MKSRTRHKHVGMTASSLFDTRPLAARMRSGLAARMAVITSLLVVAATATVGFLVYRGARHALVQASTEQFAHTAEVVYVRFAATNEAIGKDVQFLAATPPVQGIVRALTLRGIDPETAILDSEWRDQLAAIFQAFLASRPSYLQARFIGVANDGMELVRVERQNGDIYRAKRSELRSAGKQKYFTEAITLRPSQLYLSDITADTKEYGTAWTGIPIMQAATPIYAPDGRLFGIIVVDVDFRNTLDVLRSLVDRPRALYLAGNDGRFLFRPGIDASKPSTSTQRLQDVFPRAEPVLRGAVPELRLSDVLIDAHIPAIAYFRTLPFDRGVGRSDLVIGVVEPQPRILVGVRRVRNQSALITLLFGLVGIAVAYGVSRYLARPIRSITRAVTTFGHGGEHVELPVHRQDEIGILARSFDAMERQIQHQMHELADEERRQRTILETSAEGIMVTGADGIIEAFNPAAEQIFGFGAGEVIGHSAGTLIRPVDGRPEPSNVHSRFTNREWMLLQRGDEALGRRRDGHMIPLSVSWSTFEHAGEKKYTIFLRDVTEAKAAAEAQAVLMSELESERASLKRLSESLEERVRERTSDLVRINTALKLRNQDLREFVHVASHDLQEPLRKLRAFADMLLSAHAGRYDDEARHYIERMCGSAERMSQLIADLRSLHSVAAREKPFEAVDLNETVREVLSDLEIYLKESDGRVEAGSLPTIEADRVQMRQLLQNLIMNGLKFHKPGVPPVIKVDAAIESGSAPTGEEQDVCRLEVSDNGIGFDEKYLDRIFSPFQRLHTREGYEGTGMGLAICRRIAEHHGGTITAQSTPGRGATFIVTLPVQQRPMGQAVDWDEAIERMSTTAEAEEDPAG
ncbi:MAG TPA: ATP-binding protein [Rhodothermales bacterium]|nr:ATP-binding protein [Rhodothermales bacterium]